jgi:hypothetical protein
LVAAFRMTIASFAPKDFSPPMASTGIVSLVVMDAMLSLASCLIERNWAKAECIASGRA